MEEEILPESQQTGSTGQFNPKGRFMSERNLADAKKKRESASKAVCRILDIEKIRLKHIRPAPSSTNATGPTVCIFPSLQS
jgi:hypothetical protein